ncbi:MAG: DUF4249 domain-containing protein [Taibaiella sp.]|nr:DUF4249 domain-containing protein [Taibaiella sp.]
MRISLFNSNTYIHHTLAILFIIVLTLTSCEKEVHIDLGPTSAGLVVEGQIEQDRRPSVVLTQTIGFFSNVDFSTIQSNFVHNAVITVSDGTTTIPLIEVAKDTGNNSKFYIYQPDTSIATSRNFIGVIGRDYTLSITSAGKTYTATARIPQPIHIDSLTTMVPPTLPDRFPDAMNVFIHFKDPDTLGNYARYFTKRNSEPYYSSGLYSDLIRNGTVLNERIRPGYNTLRPDSSSSGIFFKGDTVTLKWASIDKGVYTFWNTFQFAEQAVGNPFATPINSQSNISNGALGVWSAYGSTIITIVIPK